MPTDEKSNLGFMCRGMAKKNPEKLAFIELEGDLVRKRTYAELDTRMDEVASMLDNYGLKLGDRLAVAVGNRIEFIEIVFGAMRAGIIPVPLNIRLGQETLTYIIMDAECNAVIIEPDCNTNIVDTFNRQNIDTKISLDIAPAGWSSFEEGLQTSPKYSGSVDLPKDFPVIQPYTSGSTGLPKGVILSHMGQSWFLNNYTSHLNQVFNEDTIGLIAVPLFHKNAMAAGIKPVLFCGGTIILMRYFDAKDFITALAEYHCSYSTGVPALYSLLLQERDLIKNTDFKDLEYLLIGSAPCPPALIEDIETTFGAQIIQGYGLTEGGPVVFIQTPDNEQSPLESCGKLMPDIEARLIDENGNLNTESGELWVRNPGIAKNYHNLPVVTAERIVDGWLSTGDLFRKDDKEYYYFLGRTDDLMISGGENVYPAEVERILMRHPDVLNASVVSLPHKTKGEVPGAMVILSHTTKLTEQSLKAFFLQEGPSYAHPRYIIIDEELPLSGTGKVDKNKVRKVLLKQIV